MVVQKTLSSSIFEEPLKNNFPKEESETTTKGSLALERVLGRIPSDLIRPPEDSFNLKNLYTVCP